MEDVPYQERLQAIAERRRQQEEEERLKRETDEEKWKSAQKQRKSLRDQWFSDPPSGDAPGLHSDLPQLHSQSTAEEGEQEVCIRGPKNSAAVVSLGKEDCNQGGGESNLTEDMLQRTFHEDGRSVLGMVAVQVERDPKTGATTVRSVAPLSAPGAGAMATTVFDDGRKSVHAIGGGGAQPSAEELGRILSAIDGVGMQVLLDDVTVTTGGQEAPAPGTVGERPSEPGGEIVEPVNALPCEAAMRGESLMGQVVEVAGEDAGGVAVRVSEVVPSHPIAPETLGGSDHEAPVVLTFLGYSDSDGQGARPEGVAVGRDDRGGVLTVERVVIDAGDAGGHGEEGEVPEPSSPGQEQKAENGAPTGPVGAPERDGAFQEIQLDGGARRIQGAEADGAAASGGGQTEGSSKHKACQCCSVM